MRATDHPCKIVATRFDSPHLHQFAGIAQWQSGALPRRRRGVRFPLSAPIRQRSSAAERRPHKARTGGSTPPAGTNIAGGKGRQTWSGSYPDIAGWPPTGSGAGTCYRPPIWCRWSARLPEEQEVPDRYRGSAPLRGGRPKGGPQPSKLVMRVRLPSSAPTCSSVVQRQDGGLLLRESRFESSRWSQIRAKCYGSTAGSNPARWGSIPHARANACREPGGLGAELQPPRTRFDSAAALQLR